MRYRLVVLLFLFGLGSTFAQTKVSGHVFDENNEPVSFANVIFKNSSEGTITNENGRFYLESDQTWETIIISFIGYETLELKLANKVSFDLKITLKEETAQLDAVVLISGKQPKKTILL